MPTRYVIEVAVETPDDARTAEVGGADRIELSAALDLGGLTPSVGLYEEVRAATRLPVVVMIRPRPGDFVYEDADGSMGLREFWVGVGDLTEAALEAASKEYADRLNRLPEFERSIVRLKEERVPEEEIAPNFALLADSR